MTVAIAHRGAPFAAPENTLEAFSAAVEMGAPAIELDVHLSADGEIVVIHDATLDRTTDATGAVADLTLAEIRAADAGYGHSPDGGRSFPFRRARVRVPTLAEVIDWLPAGIGLVVEIKAPAAAEAVAELLVASEIDRRSTAISFDSGAIDRVRSVEPGLATGLLLEPGHSFEHGLARVVDGGHATLNVFERDLGEDPRPLVERAAAAGRQLGCYVVDDPSRMRVLAAAGLAAFVTNRPDVARDALGA